MKRLVPLFAALALTPGPALAATDGENAAAIIRIVIRREAKDLRSWSEGPIACARSVIKESTFAGLRRPSGHPVQVGSNRVQLALPFAFFPGRRMSEAEVAEARKVAQAVEAIADGAGRRPPVTKLRSEWLTLPFRLCNRERYGLLELSSPVFSGDYAFVSLEWDCVLCGHGLDYALKRRGKKWVIVDSNVRWQS